MRLRSPTRDEMPQAFSIVDARLRADVDVPAYTLADLRAAWADPDFDLDRDVRVAVNEAGQILACAQIDHHGAMAAIPPEHEGKGIGAQIIEWIEERERELGRPHHAQPVAAANLHGAAFLASRGYELIRSYHRMVRPLGSDGVDAPAAAPQGIELRPIDRDEDAVILHSIDDAAFRSAPDYKPESVAAFRRRHLDLDDFDLEASLVACDGDEIVGFLLARRWNAERAGYVNVLGVHPDRQGHGIGSALLHCAFAVWTAAGLTEAQLGVSSQNPDALRLYERAGMTARFQIDVWQRDADAATRS